MTARRTVFLAAYWGTVLTAAAITATAATIPFTGVAGRVAGVLAAGVVCLVGNACSPGHRKGGRS